MTRTSNNEEIASEVMALFEEYGNEDYDGEPVSQTSHMIQCAMHAMADGEDMELILGAFLHDVGHLLKYQQETEAMGNYGVVNHEGIGANYLRNKGFSERICAMVENMLMQKDIWLQPMKTIKKNYQKQAYKHWNGKVDP